MKKLKITKFITLLLVAALVFAGCGSADGDSGSSDDSTVADREGSTSDDTVSSGDTTETEKIVIATSGAPTPYIYTDDDGNLDGYDIAVITEVFSRLPQYEIEFAVVEFSSIFTGLDAGYYQVVCQHLGWNEGRQEKYVFTYSYGYDPYAILVRDDNTDISTVYDLPGHTTEVTAASVNSEAFESFNEANPDNQIILTYTEDDNTPTRVSNGVLDFELFTKVTLQTQIEAAGLTNVKLIDVPNEDLSYLYSITVQGNYFLVPKGYEYLADDINEALAEAIEDGTISALREEYLGITAEEDQFDLEFAEEQYAIIQSLAEETE